MVVVLKAAACRGQVWGELITAAMPTQFVVESTSISVEQWFGSHADPGWSAWSLAMVRVFALSAR